MRRPSSTPVDRVARTAALLLAVVVAVHGMSSAAARQGSGPAGARQAPRIDSLTASIRGRITTVGTGAPIRRAEVRATSESGVNRLAATDAAGRFELRDLPAGRFRVTASKSGFVPLQFGQRTPYEPATMIELAEGRSVAADLALPRGGAIDGRLYDQFGDPLGGVRVHALRARMVQGERRLQAVGRGDESDDTGAFRLYGLMPGDYYVAATPPRVPGMDAPQRTAAVYFPGTVDVTQAQRITVGLSADAGAVFQLVEAPSASVSGVVVDGAGAPVEATVSLLSEAVGMGREGSLSVGGRSLPDGTFVVRNVPPGPYVLQAVRSGQIPTVSTRTDRMAEVLATGRLPGMPESGTLPLVVGGGDVTGVTVVTGTGGVLIGTFVRDDGTERPLPEGLRVTASRTRSGLLQMTGGNASAFVLGSLAGPFHLLVEGLPEEWAVKAIIVGDADVTDAPIELAHGEQATARIVLTDRLTAVSGRITAATDVHGWSVVIFHEDPAKWAYPSRYVRTVRADAQGRFQVTGLPPDERYLARAVDYLEEGDADDPEVLERMRPGATSFSLRESERTVLELRSLPL